MKNFFMDMPWKPYTFNQINFHNKENGIIPKPIIKKLNTDISDRLNPYSVIKTNDYSNSKLDASQIKKMIKHTKSEMEKAASNFSFIEATRLRDELIELEKLKNQS